MWCAYEQWSSNETQSFISCRHIETAQSHQVGNPKCSKKIPLKLVQQKFSAWKKHLVHLPIQLQFPIPSQQLMIVCRVILPIWNNPLRHLLKQVESRVQSSKSQQLLVRSRVNLETQNVSWTVEKTQDRSYHPGMITMNEKPGCTSTKRRMLRSVSHASKL